MKKQQPEMQWETVRSLRGVNKVARRVGYSHTHILRVMDGSRRASPELRRKLASLGIEVPEQPTAAE